MKRLSKTQDNSFNNPYFLTSILNLPDISYRERIIKSLTETSKTLFSDFNNSAETTNSVDNGLVELIEAYWEKTIPEDIVSLGKYTKFIREKIEDNLSHILFSNIYKNAEPTTENVRLYWETLLSSHNLITIEDYKAYTKIMISENSEDLKQANKLLKLQEIMDKQIPICKDTQHLNSIETLFNIRFAEIKFGYNFPQAYNSSN